MNTVDRVGHWIAITLMVASLVGFGLGLVRIIGKHEPFQTYLLSWAALCYAGFVAWQESRHNRERNE